jgi:periplasmic protein TonB
MVLRSTSSKVTEPEDEPVAGPDEGSLRAVQAGPRELNSPKAGSQKLVAAEVALDWVLQEIVQQSRLATTATGAFIGLLRARKIVCQATSGSNAGEFVTYLNRDRRMVDSCLSTGMVQICRDSETSEELDGSICRYLGARSVVIVPILGAEDTEKKLGVFGIFSPQADAFSNGSIVALQSLSRRIADAMAQVNRSTSVSSGAAQASLRTVSPRRQARRSLGAAGRWAVWIAAVLAAVLLVGWSVSRVMSWQGAQKSEIALAPVPVPSPPDSFAAANSLSDHTGTNPGQSLAVEPAVESQGPAVAAGNKPENVTPENVTPENAKPESVKTEKLSSGSVTPVGKSQKPVAGTVAGTVAESAAKAPAATQTQTQTKKTTVAIKGIPAGSHPHLPDLEIENELDDASSGSLPSRSADTFQGPNLPRTGASPRLTEPSKTGPSKPLPSQTGPSKTTSSMNAVPSNAVSPRVPGDASSGPLPREAVRISRAPGPSIDAAPAAASATPTSGSANSTSSEAARNPNPASSDAPSSPPVMLQEWTALAHVAQRVEPDYPPDAKTQRTQGTVVLDVVVGTDGQVAGVTPVDGDQPFVGAADKAMRKWRFTPFLRNGHAVSFESHITLNFVLP